MRGFENKEVAKKAGQKGKPTKHLKTRQWEELSDSVINHHAERFNKILDKLEDMDFVKAYTAILQYFKPKQQNVTGEIEQKQTIEFKDVSKG